MPRDVVRCTGEDDFKEERHGKGRCVRYAGRAGESGGTSQYNGKTYYFCSKGCKSKFDANPAQYAK